METIDIKRSHLFDLTGTESLVKQIEEAFDSKVRFIRTQCDLFDGYDEVSVLLANGDQYSCLAKDGKQISDWKFICVEVKR